MNNVKYLVGIGASAGGLEALSEVLSHLPPLVGEVAFVVAQQFNQHDKNKLIALLSQTSKLSIEKARNFQKIEANHVYIAPPNNEILIREGKIILQKSTSTSHPKSLVDTLFGSIAKEYKEYAMGVILSGTGSDGAEGIRAIKQKGGITIAQDPKTAKYEEMPMAAIHIGNAEWVLNTDQIAEKIVSIVSDEKRLKGFQTKTAEILPTNLDRIFSLLSKRTGTNFANYKPATIYRRLERRLEELNIPNLEMYWEYIQDHVKEIDELFNSILIGTTAFFRDKEAFAVLEKHLEEIVNSKKSGEPIRIWIVGCATGEEAYSMALLIYQYLENRPQNYSVQLFATDIDQEAINFARRGIYPITALSNVPEGMLEKFFIKKDEKYYEVIKAVRNLVLFSKHDITANPPFVRLDLISCRNLLIYFGANLQKQIFPIFHYALSLKGYLFLGKSESIGNFNSLFEPIDTKNKLFQRKIGLSSQNFHLSVFKPSTTKMLNQNEPAPTYKDYSVSDVIKDTIFQSFDHPYVLVNSNLDILEVRGEVRDFLSVGQGKSNLNLLKLVHKNLQIELRSLFNKVIKEQKEEHNSLKRYNLYQNQVFVRLKIKPLLPNPIEKLYLVIFEKYEFEEEIAKLFPKPPEEGSSVRTRELEHELEAVKEHLQTYIEEIETSNEELQSINEELQSSNEELQFSNEELETANEELQASNEELQTTYAELKIVNEHLGIKDKELYEVLGNILALLENTVQGFVLINEKYIVQIYNHVAKSIMSKINPMSLTKDMAFINLLPDEELQNFILEFKECMAGASLQIEKQIFISQTEKIWLLFSYVPIYTKERIIRSVALGILDITKTKKIEIDLRNQKELFRSLVESNTSYLIRTDMIGNYTYVNQAFCEKFGFDQSQLIGKSYLPTVHPDDIQECAKAVEKLFADPTKTILVELRKPNPKGDYFNTEWEFAAIRNEEGEIVEIQAVGRDITAHKNAEKLLEEERNQLEMMIWGGQLGTWNWNVLTGRAYFNKIWAETLGYGSEEMELDIEEWKKLIHPDDLHKVWEALQANICGETAFYEIEHRKRTKLGEWKWLVITGKVLERDETGKALRLIGIHQDITEKKRTEEAIRLSEGRAYAIYETMQEGIVIHDMTGKIISCNQSAERILGLTYEQMLGLRSIDPQWRVIREDYTPFEGENHPAMVTLRTGKPQSQIIMGVYKPDGSLSWISVNSQQLTHPDTHEPYAVFATFYDITENKRSEIEIAAKNRRISDILEGTHVGTWEWNVQTGETIFNERWAEIIGYTLAELEPINIQTWLAFAHPDDLEMSGKALEAHFKGEIGHYECEARMKHKDGHWVWVWDRGKVFSWTADGKPLWMSGTHQDITERKTLELKLIQQNSELSATEEELKTNLEELFSSKKQLEISDNKLRAIANSTQEGTILIGLDYKILFLNKYAKEKNLFYTEKDMKEGDNILDYIDETEKPSFIHYFKQAVSGQAFTIEREWHWEKKTSWFETKYFPVYDQQEILIGVSLIFNNTSIIKQYQKENERLAMIVQRTANLVIIMNPKGEIDWVNAAFTRLTEYSFEEAMGKRNEDLLQGTETDPRTLKYMENQLLAGKSFTTEIVSYSKSGKKYWLHIDCQPIKDEKGEILYFVAIETDITQRKRLEKKLFKFYQEAKNFRNALEKSAIIATYDLNRNFVEINAAFQQISGYTPTELLGQSYYKVLDMEQSNQKALEKMWRQVENGDFWRGELCRKHKNGENYWVDCVLIPIFDSKGNLSSFMAVSNDITARKKAEELNRLQAEKLKTKLETEVAEKTKALQEEKNKLETINKQVRSSIFYAKRIQTAILPHETEMRHHLSDLFIYNLPRDIVSGDFYWFGVKSGKIILSVIDCTGHGVPGAFMSMIGYALMNEIVHKEHIIEPVQILEHLNEEIKTALKQKDSQVQDGMDMAVVSIDKHQKEMWFAGAKNPIIYALNGKVQTVRGSKRHIGGKYVNKAVFEQVALPYSTEAVYYMYSDGYVDQFGGDHKRRFSHQNLEILLEQIHQKPLPEQMDILDQSFIAWMGGFGLRLDDVLVLGFKI